MEAFKLQRKTLRTAFTNFTKVISGEINKQEVDKHKLVELSTQLSDKFQRLESVQNSITEILLEDITTDVKEKEYVKDFNEAEAYREQYFSFLSKIERYEKESSVITESAPSNRKYRLPKLELQKFDGDIKSFLGFWSQFSRIHEDNEMPAEDKFQYLIQAIIPGSRAASLIESFPPTAQNYPKAIELLKERFGRDDLLVQVYVRELIKLVIKNAVCGKKGEDLTKLYDQIESHLRALDTLGRSKDKFADFLSPLVESCLPEDVLRAWERYRMSSTPGTKDNVTENSQRSLEQLMNFLRQEVNGEEMIKLATAGFGTQSKIKKENADSKRNDIPSASSLISSTYEKYRCVFCDNPSHPSQDCGRASRMNREDKKMAVIRKGLCLVCLKDGHMARNCRSRVQCIICSRRHYAILCPELRHGNHKNTSFKPIRKEDIESDNKVTKNENASTLFAAPSTQNPIYLKTLVAQIRNKGRSQCVRILLDDGSHRSYIEQSLAEELNLSPSGEEILSQGLFGGHQTPEAVHHRYSITIEKTDGTFSCPVSVLDQPTICSQLPRVRDKNLLNELENHGIVLTDIGKEDPPIRLLLGADEIGKLLTGRIEILKSGISAIETRLGWSILGSEKRKTVIGMVSLCLQNSQIPKIWELECLGINDPIESKNRRLLEEETLTHFRETVKLVEGRYEVALPWLTGHPPIYKKQDIAESRLRSVTKRLLKEENYESYNEVFRQWQSEGIIQSVPEEEILKQSHYLPHRPVLKPSSTTTKIRPVFDASFKQPGYASLNECLSVGPSLSQQITPLLLRFRLGAIGVIADIKQAFLQLSVRQEDRDALRFLWWQDDDRSKLKTYRHCRVVFGVSSSPFLLNATINHHLNSEIFGKEFSGTIETMIEGFYVDNLVTSLESEDKHQLEQFIFEAKEIMKKGNFELRCWAHTGDQEQEDQSVLGLKWNTHIDELYCVRPKMDVGSKEIVTKRKLLSIINSIYDPIGFTSPATLLPKVLLQEAWLNKLDWDTELPLAMQQRFQRWVRHIDLIEQSRIPRRMLYGTLERSSLHIFSDASAYGYACCAFLRCEEEGEVKVSLVMAKSRIAPVPRPTIPRLELLGAVIAARMAKTIIEALRSPIEKIFWTDSMVVLGWIANKEPWNTFVGNRVKEIRELTNIEEWRHVSGEVNPADLPSRLCDWSDLVRKRWWEGPKWLRESPSIWPHSDVVLPEEALLERRKTVSINLNIETDEKFSDRLLYFSSYPRILRTTAWVLRFINNCKVKSDRLKQQLSCEEIKQAEEALIRIIQSEWSLEIRQTYSRSMKIYEQNGILRVESKLILSQDPEDFVRPIILPDHPITRRMVEYYHKKYHHTGVQATLTHLRQRFWIPRGRRVVRNVLQKCVICKRHSSTPVIPETSPLPVDRINRVAAFQVTGADLAGPLYLKGGIKAWVVIFTCAVYRAIHLELITALSTEAFMQSLRRFFARRGRCKVLYTDNGTNFLGASRALNSLNWNNIATEFAVENIEWHFNPPTAAWYGGWWERMIRTIKQLLKKSLGRACITYEEMTTLLCECESVVNGRPLTYVSDDPNELKPLTPSHFIQDIKGNETVDFDIIDAKHLRKRIRYLQSLRDQLRQRFKEEYLAELVRCPQTSNRKKLAPGDIVLIGSDNKKRLNWPLGRVLELFPGKDNIERVARVRVENREIIRPVQRIYPLEISGSEINKEVVKSLKDVSLDSGVEIVKTQDNIKQTRSGRHVVPVNRLNL